MTNTGELRGHIVPMVDLPFDHAFVTSSAGDRWDCKGRSEGGRILCRGDGHLELAKCLARPAGNAGIAYGMTGVCLQIANRILWPAAVLVEQARGYNTSFKLFGHYGPDLGLSPFWPERGRCLDELAGTGLRDEVRAWPDEGLREPEAAYAMQSDPFVTQSIERMNLLLDRALGGGLDPGVRARVEQIVASTAARQRELVLAWQRGEMAPEVYLDRFTRLVAADFRRIDEVLGRDAFLAVFGESPDEAARIIDPEAFAAAHGLSPPD